MAELRRKGVMGEMPGRGWGGTGASWRSRLLAAWTTRSSARSIRSTRGRCASCSPATKGSRGASGVCWSACPRSREASARLVGCFRRRDHLRAPLATERHEQEESNYIGTEWEIRPQNGTNSNAKQLPNSFKEMTGPRMKTDEDQKQRAYAIFLSVTQKNINCVGIHTWSLCAATRANRSFCSAIAAMVPSIVLLVLQCFVLHAVSIDSLHPPCTNNWDCHAGMWCAPSRGPGGYTSTPGMCDDCKWANLLSVQDYTNLHQRYDTDAYQAASSSLAAAVSYCNAEDAFPDRCDFVVDFRNQLTLGAFLVFFFVTWLVLVFYVVDMDKQTLITDVFAFRVEHVASFGPAQARVIQAVAWVIFNFRKFVLPGVVAYSFASLVLASPSLLGLSLPVCFVLDGLAIGFVYSIDGVLAWALLDGKSQGLIRQAFADMEAYQDQDEEHDPLAEAWLPYFGNRLLAFCFGTLILVGALATETMMDEVPLLVESPSPRACTNVGAALSMATAILVIFLMLVWTCTLQDAGSFACHWTGALDVVLSPVVALVTLPMLALVFTSVGYAPI
ncbi:unnamed protein product [Prorocentrum cordatum]|uniref:Uncharacterized protein n=1 Tax=Prorocentrum cordatum TaxID=2364126 RepID=A0ABN9UTR5_9DINO|nr:unnamed protein product [Polarella glacialis]